MAYTPQILKRINAAGKFSQIARGVKLGNGVEIGGWPILDVGAQIGNRVEVGDWAYVGKNAEIGIDVVLGSHAMVGDGAVIGAGCILPDHVRVQPGVVVPAGTIFEGHELVTENGNIDRRCSGFMYTDPDLTSRPIAISGYFGQFRVPQEEFTEKMIDDHMWGVSDALEQYRISEPAAELEAETPQM